MPIKSEDLKRPNPRPADRAEYSQQNVDSIGGAIALRAQETAQSLQALNDKLENFENRYADAVCDRIDQIPLRIERAIAFRLQARQHSRKPQLDVIDSFEVPSLDLPPMIAPASSPMGCLPIS